MRRPSNFAINGDEIRHVVLALLAFAFVVGVGLFGSCAVSVQREQTDAEAGDIRLYKERLPGVECVIGVRQAQFDWNMQCHWDDE